LTLAQPNTWSSAIFVDEIDPSALESLLQDNKGCAARFGGPCFDLSNSHDPQPGMIGEVLLAPIEETSGCSALGGFHHGGTML
jgi:hypothetical protein